MRKSILFLLHALPLFGAVYEVGPGKTYADPLALPWNTFADGDTVKIYYQSSPYKTQLYVGWSNFTISCIAGPNGERPIIDGDGAVASSKVTFFNLDRGLIRIGESSSPPGKLLENVTIEGCELRNVNRAKLGYRMENGTPGVYQPWALNGAAIQATGVKNLVVRNNYIHDNLVGTSAFSNFPASRVSQNCQILYNTYVNNGGLEDAQNHVTYTECNDETIVGNTVTQPANWSSVFKSRGAKTKIFSNYIYGGDASADLVDSVNMRAITGNVDPDIIANNFITKLAGYDNDRYIHFGGDSGNYTGYRKNTLYVANNTVYSQRNGNVLVRVSSYHQNVVLINNVIHWAFLPTYGFYLALTTPGRDIGPGGERSTLRYSYNWIQKGSCPYADYPNQYCGLVGNLTTTDGGNNTWAVSTGVGNISPTNTPKWDSLYRPTVGSPLIDGGSTPTDVITDWTFNGTRTTAGRIDIGAYEYVGRFFSNATKITANATQSNRPFTLFPTFAYDEICDYPKPFVDGSAPAAWQVDIYSRWPASSRCASGSVKKAYVSFHLSVTSGVTYTVDYRDNANPCHLGNLATCQAAAYDQAGFLALSWSASMSLTPAPVSSGATTQVVSARTMLSGGLWSYRLRGPVVTQIKVEDTSTARSTDFGWREKRAARLTEDLLNGDTSFQVSADWSGLSRPFKVQLGFEIVSVCYASYNTGTGNSTLTVGLTNGSNTSCATLTGRGQDGTGAYNHYYQERRESVRLWSNSPLYHLSGITSSYTTTVTVNDAATINNVTLLKAGFELLRICNKSGNTLTIGLGAWPCTANVAGRTWWGTRRAVQVNDNDGGEYPVNGVLDNWSSLPDVWVDAENDRYKSLHPIFILTAYPAWSAVGIEYHIANTWHDRLQDQYYTVSLSPAGVTIPDVLHKAMTIWKYPDGPTVGTFGTGLGDRKIWDGTAPASVRLDYNLPYLRYAGVVPHDPDVQINSSALDTLLGTSNRSHDGTTYAWENSDKGAIPRGALWISQNHRDNCALEYKYLGNPGGRPDIAPIPFWHATALYAMASPLTNADRWAEALFGVAACSGYVPYHLWEGDTDSSRKFCAPTDTTLDSCTGANALVPAFYRPWSIDARPESYLTFDQSNQGDPTKRLLYQADQSYGNWGMGDGNAHWPSHNFIPWLLSGDWYYERGQLDEGARSLMFSNSSATTRRGSWGLPDWYNMSRPISWHMRNITLAAWASPNGSPEESYFTDKINKWIEFQEGRYNITDGSFYNPCTGGPSDKTSTPWCYGRRTEQNDAPTTEFSVPYFGGVASWGWNDWGNVLKAYTYHIKSAWMDNYGLASMGWGYNLGFTQYGPILNRVYLRNNVYLLLHPAVNPFNIGEYRDPAIPCRPEGVAASPDCRNQTFASGEQRFFSDYAAYQASWNSTAQAKRALDNDADEQGGYSTIHRSTVAFADRVRNGAMNGPRAWEFLKYAFNDTQGKATGTPMWTFSPQYQHTIDIRTNPTGGGNFSFTFTTPNGGACSYLISSSYPASSLTTSDTTVSGGTRDRKVTLTGQTSGSKYLRVTCGDSARKIISFTQP